MMLARRGLILMAAVVLGSSLSRAQVPAAGAQGPRWYPTAFKAGPSQRMGPGMAYDSGHSESVLFGGLGPSALGPVVYSDTWTFAAGKWSQLSPAASPPARTGGVLAYDSGHGNMVLFGGAQFYYNLLILSLGDTWVWDGTNWSQKFPANSPSPRYGYGMVYDAAHGQTVLFGGTNGSAFLQDTWVWDGVNWTQEFPETTPPARYYPAMDYDPVLNETVMFGGGTASVSLGDTWVWDGNNWTQLFPASSPSARFGATMAYDAAEGQSILFAGTNQTATLNDTWAWNGSTWTQEAVHDLLAPPIRFYPGMDYDPSAGQIVLFGGARANVFMGDTWLWH